MDSRKLKKPQEPYEAFNRGDMVEADRLLREDHLQGSSEGPNLHGTRTGREWT